MWKTSACDASIFLEVFWIRNSRMSRRHDWACWDSVFLPWVTWLERAFSSLLNFLPNRCQLANWSLPLSFSPSLLGSILARRASSTSRTSSSTLSSVLVTKHNLSPDCLKSSCAPRTLHRVLKSNSLFLDILHPSNEKRESAQNSTCFDSLLLVKQGSRRGKLAKGDEGG